MQRINPCPIDVQVNVITQRPRKKIKAIEIVRSLREGISDSGIMHTFGLTTKNLEWIMDQLESRGLVSASELEKRLALSKVWDQVDIVSAKEKEVKQSATIPKPVIDAADALRCIRAGMTDEQLMERYRITAKGVQSLQRKLLSANVISPAELESRGGQDEPSVDLDEVTEHDKVVAENQPLPKERDLLDHLRSGAERNQLLETYKVSTLRLVSMLEDLVSRNLISKQDLNSIFPAVSGEIEIRDRFTNEIIYKEKASSLEELVEQAVQRRVNLANAKLDGIDLARADLSWAILSDADLTRASLVGANLTGARLRGAKLAGADMYGANLFKANLGGADCSEANMSNISAAWAFLANANLSEANLTGANLAGTNLAGANLFEAILAGTNLWGAYLEGANIENARR
jgi:uncharacterized protein YjbI with pentapeptide repeats/uncharacterized protein (DUF433 family)